MFSKSTSTPPKSAGESSTMSTTTNHQATISLPLTQGTTRSKTAYALFIGRWQPFHEGHQWLIQQKLDQGVPVWIAVRDMEVDDDNPYYAHEVVARIRAHYGPRDDVLVTVIPNIESVNYGRGVGYEINEWQPPALIGEISATKIRQRGDAP